MSKQWDAIWYNGRLATCEQGYGLMEQAAIGVKNGKIVWLGKTRELSDDPDQIADITHDLQGRTLTPGLIDCHTHLVYAGNRANEFAQRLNNVSYADIAKAGGGIQATVTATRAATEEDLFRQSMMRARALIASGVTTLEIKTGYGLDWPTELKMLRVARLLADTFPITIKKTFLGAHTIPLEFKANPDAYVELLCEEMIPAVAKDHLADAVDVFCETIAFSLAQTEKIFRTARKHGLQIKCHAEQLSDSGSAGLAAKHHALSVDHLEYVSETSIKALATSGTVAVLLPGAFYFLRETKLPPITSLREHGVRIAIASDCNPGTSPVCSLLIILNMACTLFRLTPEEALLGVTKHAAQALGMGETHGSLAVGKMADFAVWDISHPVDLAYYLGATPLTQLVKAGVVVEV